MYQKVRKFVSLLIYPALFAFGVLYALFIALRPLSARYTWLEVVMGDAATDAGMSALLWRLTHDRRVVIVPWMCHALTGSPMILGQVLKHKLQEDDAKATIRLVREE
jgi:hypothetical protein